jgi:hypothetical protein
MSSPTSLVGERTPLMEARSSEGERGEDEEMMPLMEEEQATMKAAAYWLSTRFLLQLCFLVFLIDFSGYLTVAPLTELFENIICRYYYADSRFPQPLGGLGLDCKADVVQSELAFIRGWREAVGQVPGQFGFIDESCNCQRERNLRRKK